MASFEERIASLSPEKRRAFERLRNQSHATSGPTQAASSHSPRASIATPVPSQPTSQLVGLDALDGEKGSAKRFYDSISGQLDSTPFGGFAFFLNYGFVSDGSREFAAVALPEHDLNRNSVKLVLEVIGDCPLDERSILDVGCGRGGTVATLHRFFRPSRICGLDLSSSAIRFCAQTHRFAQMQFVEGDAEHLPFEDGAFDVVINLESSHLYPNVGCFYREVFRALRGGGDFLYADLQATDRWLDLAQLLREQGFECVRERDITPNVLLSCDQIAHSRVQAYQSPTQAGLLEEFLGAPGSQVYRELERGAWSYRILTLRKG